jgi:dTMP kinase
VSSEKTHGSLFVIEGGDGAGKRTQAELLQKALVAAGHDTIYTDEPSSGGLGDQIRKDLASTKEHLSPRTLQLLFTADRANHVEKVVEPALKSGTNVVADRYWPSTIAYSTALGTDRNDVELLLHANENMFPKPDKVFILALEPEVAVKRMQERGRAIDRHESDMKLQKGVQEAYKELAKRFGRDWIVIDANRSVEEIHDEIMAVVLGAI